MNTETCRYEIMTQEDPETGDVILPLPQELLDKLGWKPGDELSWNESETGSWILSKKIQ